MSNSSTSRLWRLIAILAVFAMIAAACGSDTTEDTEAPTTDATEAPAEDPTTDATDAPAEDPPATEETTPPSGEEFTYRLGMTSDITTTNYWAYLGGDTTVYNAYVLGPAKNGLFAVDLPSLAIIPGLAEGLPVDPVEEGDTWSKFETSVY